MKFKKTTIAFFSIIVLFCAGFAFSTYKIIESSLFKSASYIDEDENYVSVTFNYDGNQKEIIKEKNSFITTSDAPVQMDGSNYYVWSYNNQVVLDPSNKNKSKYQVTKDIILNGTKQSATNNVNDVFTYDKDNSNNDVNINSNTIKLTENTSPSDSTKPSNTIEAGGVTNNVIIDGMYKDPEGNDTITNNLSGGDNYSFQVNKDASGENSTIGLEDKTSEISDYKPNAGPNSININNCINRIVLTSDLYLTNNTTINLGARTGFYGNNEEFSQYNFQGYIIGEYSEIDLCGYNLIIGNGCTLNAYGSITNSKETGYIIVENGGKLTGTFVVEDQNHERGMPVSYGYGDAVFSMYRMPYLNCNIKVNYGGMLNGVMRIDFGGNNSHYTDQILYIVGVGNEYIIQMTDNNSYIIRKCTYDKTLINSTGYKNSFSEKNIMAQKIIYEIHDNKVSYLNINMPTLSVEFSIGNMSVDFNKGNFNVSPYYDFYVYNSNIIIKNNITFLPGSYLYVDSNSKIKFSCSDFREFNNSSIHLNPLCKIRKSGYQGVGGLNFTKIKYDFNEATSKWVTDNDNLSGGTDGSRNIIYKSSEVFWKYVNKIGSYCDMFGSFEFDANNLPIDTNNTTPKKYSLGGDINIYNMEKFKETISELNYFNSYNVTFKSGPNMGENGLFNKVSFNVTDYFINPLVVNNNVVMDVENNLPIRTDFDNVISTYDYKTGIISYKLKSYAFFFVDESGTYNYSCEYLNKTNTTTSLLRPNFEKDYKNIWNDSYGEFVEVNITGNYVTCNVSNNIFNNNTYAFFRGCMVPYKPATNGNHEQINISKFRSGTKVVGSAYDERNASFVNYSYYGYETWRLD